MRAQKRRTEKDAQKKTHLFRTCTKEKEKEKMNPKKKKNEFSLFYKTMESFITVRIRNTPIGFNLVRTNIHTIEDLKTVIEMAYKTDQFRILAPFVDDRDEMTYIPDDVYVEFY